MLTKLAFLGTTPNWNNFLLQCLSLAKGLAWAWVTGQHTWVRPGTQGHHCYWAPNGLGTPAAGLTHCPPPDPPGPCPCLWNNFHWHNNGFPSLAFSIGFSASSATLLGMPVIQASVGRRKAEWAGPAKPAGPGLGWGGVCGGAWPLPPHTGARHWGRPPGKAICLNQESNVKWAQCGVNTHNKSK